MEKHILYSYIPIDSVQETCTVVLLVPPGEFNTTLEVDNVPISDLYGTIRDDYLTYKVPGVHKFQNLTQGVILDKSIKIYVNRFFKSKRKDEGILFGFVGKGEILVEKATLYALVPKLSWKFKGPAPTFLKSIPKRLRMFHQCSIPDEPWKYYIVRIPGTIRCTYLEPYDTTVLEEFMKTLDLI